MHWMKLWLSELGSTKNDNTSHAALMLCVGLCRKTIWMHIVCQLCRPSRLILHGCFRFFCLFSIWDQSSVPSFLWIPLFPHFPTSFCHSPRPPGLAPHIHQTCTIKKLCSQHGGAIGRTIMEATIYGPKQACACISVCRCRFEESHSEI